MEVLSVDISDVHSVLNAATVHLHYVVFIACLILEFCVLLLCMWNTMKHNDTLIMTCQVCEACN